MDGRFLMADRCLTNMGLMVNFYSNPKWLKEENINGIVRIKTPFRF
jgi:hypothetical protein